MNAYERFPNDDELPRANAASPAYQEGVRDAVEGNGYNQHYAGYICEESGEHIRPAGARASWDYDQGFKNHHR